MSLLSRLLTRDVLGFPFAFGIFADFYSSHEPFAGSNNIPVIGTCAMVSPMAYPLLSRGLYCICVCV